MSGHSKWSTIKHKKTVKDAKRANAFSRLTKDITIAARAGGDPEANFKLRLAMDKAKVANVPFKNIERAIERGTGKSKEGVTVEEIIYEAYGPGQVAMLIRVMTDNKNRSLMEIKNILKKNGGKLVKEGSVGWQFEKLGIISANPGKLKEDDLETIIIESGAKDYCKEKGRYKIFTVPHDLQKIKDMLETKEVEVEMAELGYISKNPGKVSKDVLVSYNDLLQALEECEDIVEMYDNVDRRT